MTEEQEFECALLARRLKSAETVATIQALATRRVAEIAAQSAIDVAKIHATADIARREA